jgi:hypothetical protein
MFVSTVYCVGSGLCDVLITRTEESYWVCMCVCVCVACMCVCGVHVCVCVYVWRVCVCGVHVCVCGCVVCVCVCVVRVCVVSSFLQDSAADRHKHKLEAVCTVKDS